MLGLAPEGGQPGLHGLDVLLLIHGSSCCPHGLRLWQSICHFTGSFPQGPCNSKQAHYTALPALSLCAPSPLQEAPSSPQALLLAREQGNSMEKANEDEKEQGKVPGTEHKVPAGLSELSAHHQGKRCHWESTEQVKISLLQLIEQSRDLALSTHKLTSCNFKKDFVNFCLSFLLHLLLILQAFKGVLQHFLYNPSLAGKEQGSLIRLATESECPELPVTKGTPKFCIAFMTSVLFCSEPATLRTAVKERGTEQSDIYSKAINALCNEEPRWAAERFHPSCTQVSKERKKLLLPSPSAAELHFLDMENLPRHLKVQGWTNLPFLSEVHGEPHLNNHKITLTCFMFYHSSNIKIYLDDAGSSPVFTAFCSACYRLDCFQLWKTLQEVYFNRFLMWIRNKGNLLVLENTKDQGGFTEYGC
ncbi:hypothetical protein EK904_014452 [Melospiza melodia maxima]|nr:hypothetical protein EK904_014452 [Melospiza melodia maxima]